MKKTACLILFLFTAKIISAQCDSLLKLLDAEKNDTLRLRKYVKLIDCYNGKENFAASIDLLGNYKVETDNCIAKYKDSIYFRNYLGDITSTYYFKGDIQKALDVSLQLLNYNVRRKDSVNISSVLSNVAVLYRRMGNYPRAIYYLTEAIKLNEKTKKSLASNYSNLANVYNDIHEYDKAKELLIKALQIRIEEKDEKGITTSYSNIANNFFKVKQYDSAIYYYTKTIYLNEKQNAPVSKKALTLNNLITLYIQLLKLDSAEKYLNMTAKLINDQSNPAIVAHYFENKGDINRYKNKFKEALEDYNHSMVLSSANNDLNRVADLYLDKSLCFYKLRNIDSTFINRAWAQKYKDSLFSTSKTAEITRYEMQYEFDKEQETIKSEQLKKEIEAKNALERKQLLIYAALAGLVLLLGLVVIVLKSNNQKKKDNLLLRQKNDLIESQKKDIIDSINYAKNLQQAILPPLTKIKEELGDSFVYYKPKDIIAGDFYWLYKTKDAVLFAVADCTGHGVPGAMVSVVCSNALDSSVKEYGLNDPGQILDKTKDLVLETFSKTSQNVKDGMDISLCSIQRNGNIINVKWAGANNSLWYIHNNEIKELTANKQPIGLSEHSKPFTTQTLDLNKGDTLFFSTDGYYDQFGGDKGSTSGKKFMRKRLAQLFFDMKELSTADQLAMIDKTFNSWKGKLEQIDDVCIAGIKL
ncbi:MAG: tetratricopeptide repeat protein [Bacteroidia bacterium]|nr:tetratricopeptide repeat protein [Bacteroidia bacterium]